MLTGFLSNVPIETADFLAYTMMVLVAVFLIFGPSVTYYYWRKNKKMRAAEPADAPTEAA